MRSKAESRTSKSGEPLFDEQTPRKKKGGRYYGKFRTKQRNKERGPHTRGPDIGRHNVRWYRTVGHHHKPVRVRGLHDRRNKPPRRGEEPGSVHNPVRVPGPSNGRNRRDRFPPVRSLMASHISCLMTFDIQQHCRLQCVEGQRPETGEERSSSTRVRQPCLRQQT